MVLLMQPEITTLCNHLGTFILKVFSAGSGVTVVPEVSIT